LTDKQRIKPRLTLNAGIRIRNMMTDCDVGELVNLTDEGLMIVSDSPINNNAVYQFELTLPEKVDEQDALEIGVECLWCRQIDESNRFWSGYQIIDASAQALNIVRELLRREVCDHGALAAN
jgi:hypothetical protein